TVLSRPASPFRSQMTPAASRTTVTRIRRSSPAAATADAQFPKCRRAASMSAGASRLTSIWEIKPSGLTLAIARRASRTPCGPIGTPAPAPGAEGWGEAGGGEAGGGLAGGSVAEFSMVLALPGSVGKEESADGSGQVFSPGSPRDWRRNSRGDIRYSDPKTGE